MSRLFGRRKPDDEERSFVWPFPGMSLGAPTYAGVSVSESSALRSMAVTACVRTLKTAVSNLPVDAVRYRSGARQPVDPAPPVVTRPSGRSTRRVWVAQMMHGLLTNGNAYGLGVRYDATGRPAQVETVNPGDVVWVGDEARLRGKPVGVWPDGDLIHIPSSAFAAPGSRTSLSPVDLAKEAIGAGLAAENYGARFFRDGAMPTAVISSKSPLTADQAAAIKARAQETLAGSREVAVFGADLEFKPLQSIPKDNQFVDLVRFEVEQVCRLYGVPPAMVYAAISGQNVTYANATQADQQFLKFSVQSWLADLEDAWSAWLTAPVIVKFNVDALLRMDQHARFQRYEIALRNKLTTVNEVRALEDQLPFPDPEYDEPGVPGGAPTPTPGAQQDDPSD